MWFHSFAPECDCSSCLFAAKEEEEEEAAGVRGGGAADVCVCFKIFLAFFFFLHLVVFRGVRGRQCQIKTAETLLVSPLLFLSCLFLSLCGLPKARPGPRLQTGEREGGRELLRI